MKKSLLPVITAMVLSASLSALAGTDFQAIENARAAKQAAAAAQTTSTISIDRATGQQLKCPPAPLVLPLDHGPRAQTTPGENRMRKARYEAQMKVCANPES